MKRYRVLLRVDIDGQICEVDQVVELPLETAKEYSHALMAVEEEGNGGNGEE